MKKTKQHKGQVALVLVLIMTVVSALAVSMASRSTIDTKIQESETESVQALLYAQTGLEQMIMNPQDSVTDTNYTAVRTDEGSESLEVDQVKTGSTLELNLVGANFLTLTGINVYWGPVASGEQPAVFISVIENSGTITDYAYAYTDDNGFTEADDSSGGYAKETPDIMLNNNVVKVRITVLGAPALLKVVPIGGGAFPPQVKSIKSIGTVQSADKSVKYGLQYDESTADNVPAVFDYALFSGGSIIQ